MSYDPLIRKLVYGTPDERKYICKERIDLFALVYFNEYFKFKMAPFHQDFFEDGQKLETGELTEALWIAYRESAKTSDAKIIATHAICYQKKHYVQWGSYDKENAEAALFDIVMNLQTNAKILHDFGSLYTERRSDDEKKLKRVSTFITATDIKVEAISTQESTRGKVYKTYRPDFYIYDDIENDKTKVSAPITRKIIRHVEEARAGVAPDGVFLYLANYITETGVVNHLMNVIQRNSRGKIRRIDAIMNGKPSWPAKYVLKDRDLSEEGNAGKVSLESVRRRLGEISWRENMMNDPAGVSEPFFDRRKIDNDLAKCIEPIENIAGFQVYARYNPAHRYSIGGDTSMGVGLDSCASAAINHSRIPRLVVATYADNHIPPDLFAYELKKQGNYYGGCLVAPEANGESGGACINTFKNIYKNVYQTKQIGRLFDQSTKKVGWVTNGHTKPEMFFKFKSDYESGDLEILDRALLMEMRTYTVLDIRESNTDLNGTRHFDKLTAACISNMMREDATFAPKKKKFVQREWESPSIESESRTLNPTRSGFKQSPYEPPTLQY